MATHDFFEDTKSNSNPFTQSGLYLAGANLSKNGKETTNIDVLAGQLH